MTKVVYESNDKRSKRYSVEMRSDGAGWYEFNNYSFLWLAKFVAWFLTDSRYRGRVVDNRD